MKIFKITLLLLGVLTFNKGFCQKLSSRLDTYLLSGTARQSDDFIPVLIKLKSSTNHDNYNTNNLSERSKQLMSDLVNDAHISQSSLVAELEKGRSQGKVRNLNKFWIANIISAEVKIDQIPILQAISEVIYMDLDVELELESPENEVNSAVIESSTESGLKIINAHRLWEMGYTGSGRIMMNIDTGVDGDHASLSGTWRGNHVPANQAWLDHSLSPSTTPTDCGSHGTHVMGIMGGLDASTSDTIGVAFNAQWIASKGLCGGSGTRISRHIASFEWAMNPDGDLNTTHDMPDVINNSWRDPTSDFCNPIYEELFTNVEEIGIAIVFSAGNSGSGIQTITTPKNINTSLVNTFATGNIVGDDYLSGDLTPISSSSSRGPSQCGGTGSLLIKPEVCAPGTDIRSAIPGGFGNKTGTSMAAPHVAGAIVLLKQAFPNLSGEEIKLALYYTAIDLGDPGEDNTYGNGLIDAYAAYQYLALSCQNEILITNDIVSDQSFSASTRIVANSKINDGVNAVFTAGTEILLNAGFHSMAGSSFLASIEDCNGTNSRVSTYTAKLNNVSAESRFESQNDAIISTYPNPTTDRIKITNQNFEDLEPYSIMFIDSNGRMLLYIENLEKKSVEIEISSWKEGIYFGRIQGKNYSKSMKIIKE